MRSNQYRAWTCAHNCVACTCTVTVSQPFRVWGLFKSWRCALQPCPMCCTNALMLFNLHCSCLNLTCIARFLAVHLEPHLLVVYSHKDSYCPLGSPWVPNLMPAHCANMLQMCTIAPCPSGISCYELSGCLAGCKRANSAPTVHEVQTWDVMQNDLQVLWLADNQISCIAGLSQLTALQELNLARNLIEVVSDTLGANTALHTLNLADNRLGSFKQVCL